MIIRLSGGLGNQLSEYAFGRAKSLRNGKKLYYDDFSYLRDKKRVNELSAFELKAEKVSIFQKFRFNVAFYAHDKLGFRTPYICFEHMPFAYQEDAVEEHNYSYYCGSWINTRYFEDIREELSNDFWPVNISDNIQSIGKQMSLQDSIAVHVRRGDYLLNPAAKVTDISYYKKAFDYICTRIGKPVFYVFSDDIKWCKENITQQKMIPTGENIIINYIEGNTTLEDFYLMRMCKHHVISNSTFSWWAAWLSDNEVYENIKVSPAIWSENKAVNDSILAGLIDDFVLF